MVAEDHSHTQSSTMSIVSSTPKHDVAPLAAHLHVSAAEQDGRGDEGGADGGADVGAPQEHALPSGASSATVGYPFLVRVVRAQAHVGSTGYGALLAQSKIFVHEFGSAHTGGGSTAHSSSSRSRRQSRSGGSASSVSRRKHRRRRRRQH